MVVWFLGGVSQILKQLGSTIYRVGLFKGPNLIERRPITWLGRIIIHLGVGVQHQADRLSDARWKIRE